MKNKFPNTPFATRLSGSAKETQLRIHSIFQWKKERPSVWLFTFIVVVIFGCIGLVSCRDGSDLPELTLSDGSRVYAGKGLLNDPTADIFLQNSEGDTELLAQLPYDSHTLDWSTVTFREFEDVLGESGVVISYQLGDAVRRHEYWTIGGKPLTCTDNDTWEIDLDGDGQKEIINHTNNDRHYLEITQRLDGDVIPIRLNEIVATAMGLDDMVWVELLYYPDTGLVAAAQTMPNGEKQNRTFTIEELFELANGSVQQPELFERNPKIGDPFLRFAGMKYQNVDIPDASGQCMEDIQSNTRYYFFGTQGLPGLSEMPDKYKQKLRCAGIVSTIGEMIPEITGSMSLDEFLKLFGIWNYTYGYEDAPDQGWLNILMDDRFTTWIHTDNPVVEVHDPAAVVVDSDDVLLFIDGTIELENYMICEDYWNEIMMAEIRR